MHNLEHGYDPLVRLTIADDSEAMDQVQDDRRQVRRHRRQLPRQVHCGAVDLRRQERQKVPDGQHIAFTHWSARQRRPTRPNGSASSSTARSEWSGLRPSCRSTPSRTRPSPPRCRHPLVRAPPGLPAGRANETRVPGLRASAGTARRRRTCDASETGRCPLRPAPQAYAHRQERADSTLCGEQDAPTRHPQLSQTRRLGEPGRVRSGLPAPLGSVTTCFTSWARARVVTRASGCRSRPRRPEADDRDHRPAAGTTRPCCRRSGPGWRPRAPRRPRRRPRRGGERVEVADVLPAERRRHAHHRPASAAGSAMAWSRAIFGRPGHSSLEPGVAAIATGRRRTPGAVRAGRAAPSAGR